jgi:hypothetical protein
VNERSERDLRLQISEERREIDAANAKRDERMSVLEARFEGLSRAHRAVIGLFATLCVTVVGGAAAIILTSGGPH